MPDKGRLAYATNANRFSIAIIQVLSEYCWRSLLKSALSSSLSFSSSTVNIPSFNAISRSIVMPIRRSICPASTGVASLFFNQYLHNRRMYDSTVSSLPNTHSFISLPSGNPMVTASIYSSTGIRCSSITHSSRNCSPNTFVAYSHSLALLSSPLPIVAEVPIGHREVLGRLSFNFNLRIRFATSVPCAPSYV